MTDTSIKDTIRKEIDKRITELKYSDFKKAKILLKITIAFRKNFNDGTTLEEAIEFLNKEFKKY